MKSDGLICMRLIDMKRVHPYQDNNHKCSLCGETVGIYPSGQRVLMANPTLQIICHVCYESGNGADITILAPGAISESEESVSNENATKYQN